MTNEKKINKTIAIIMIILLICSPILSVNTIYADSDMASFKITFNGNGGKTSYSSKIVTEGSLYGDLPTATREKHKFLGWYTEKKGGKKITASTEVGTEPETVYYARWERQYLVVINAGHQSKGNLKKEPYGPGSKIKKYKVTSGTRGIATKVQESKRNLQIAKRLAKDLKAKGVKVYMIRTKEKVNIANSVRAKRANKKKADLVISLHCDASSNKSVKGMTMLVPKKNKWTKKHYKESLKAGKTVLKEAIKATKAKNRNISKRNDITGFNYSKIPTILIEMGFMTNKSEDKKLGRANYQKKISSGISKGIVKYLKTLE